MEENDYALVGVTGDLQDVTKAEPYADYIELQLDRSANPLEQLAEYSEEIPLIVSNRPEWAGGVAMETGRLDELLAAAKSDAVEMVEIELKTVEEQEWIVDELRQNNVELIVSYYNYDQTPEAAELQQTIMDCVHVGDIARVSVFAEEREDALLLLDTLNTASQRGNRVTGVSLGEIGQHTRVIGVFYGSELCYGPIDTDRNEPENGEIELEELANLLETTVHGGDDVELIDQLKGKF